MQISRGKSSLIIRINFVFFFELQKADARIPRDDYTSESERSELSDIAEEAEEELSDFADGSLPGFSDESEAKVIKRMKRREDEQKKKVEETLKVSGQNCRRS